VGGGDLEKIIRERARRRREAVEEAWRFASCAEGKLGRITVIMAGSYARGDFNEWSDIDLLVVTDKPLPPNPIHRLSMVEDCIKITPDVEPVILTVEELWKRYQKNDPLVREAMEKGLTIIDKLKLKEQTKQETHTSA
jgi:predicted nucleotidyltransferase